MGRVVDDPDPRKEIAVDEAKKGDNKDERTKKPDEAKSGKDAERKKVLEHFRKKGFLLAGETPISQ